MRLIDADALKKAIMNDLGLGDEENGSDAEYMSGLQDCYNLIDNAPTVEYPFYQEAYQTGFEEGQNARPKGEWIIHKDYDESCKYGCNQCGNLNNIPKNFCPDCGAKMRLKLP